MPNRRTQIDKPALNGRRIGIRTMSYKKWMALPDHSCQRPTEQHARRAHRKGGHLAQDCITHGDVVAVLFKGRMYKADGHTRTWLWEHGYLAQPEKVYVLVYEVGTERDFEQLYYRFNERRAAKKVPAQVIGVASSIGLTLTSPCFRKGTFKSALERASDFVVSDADDLHLVLDDWMTELRLADGLNLPGKGWGGDIKTAILLAFRRWGEQETAEGRSVRKFWLAVLNDQGIKGIQGRDGVQAAYEIVSDKARPGGFAGWTDTYERLISCVETYMRGRFYRQGPERSNPERFRTRETPNVVSLVPDPEAKSGNR